MKGVNKGIINESDKNNFAELTKLPVEQQAQKFLRSFVIGKKKKYQKKKKKLFLYYHKKKKKKKKIIFRIFWQL